jgi:hypothetical protein
MKIKVQFLCAVTLAICVIGCEVPTLPLEQTLTSNYDPDSPTFNDELIAGEWDSIFVATPSYTYQRSAVVVDGICYVLGGTELRNGYVQPSNRVCSISLREILADTSRPRVSTLSNMLAGRHFPAVASVGSGLYAIGGDSNATYEMCAAAGGVWTDLGMLPSRELCWGAFAIPLSEAILVGGGHGTDGAPNRQIWKYAPLVNLWEAFAAMPEPFSYADVIIVNQRLYVIGGYDSVGQASARIHVLGLSGGDWALYPSELSEARAHVTSVVWNGDIYSFGGETHPGTISRAVDEIKLTAGKCVSKQQMQLGIMPYGSVTLNGKMLFIGGSDLWPLMLLQFTHY